MWWAVLVTVTPRDPGVRSSAGSRSAVSVQWPRWSTPNCISKPSTVRASAMAITPALLIRRSRWSWAARICPTARRPDARAGGADLRDRGGGLLLVAHGHHDVGPLRRQVPGRHQSKAAVGAGHDGG